MRVGVCSIALDDRPLPRALASIAAMGARAVEVTARRHRPVDPRAAARVAQRASDVGLDVSCYGSYLGLCGHETRYRLEAVPDAARELDIAAALHAPLVRVWAGGEPSATAPSATRGAVVDELRRVSGLAAERGLRLAVERHADTLADTDPRALLAEVARPDVLGLNYQAIAGGSPRDVEQLAALAWHCHMYDLSPSGRRQPFGTSGHVDAQLGALRAAHFTGDVMVEFPTGEGDPVDLVARDVAYLRHRLS